MHELRRILLGVPTLMISLLVAQGAELGVGRATEAAADYDTAKVAAQNAIQKFRVASGLNVELVANEPQLENPVAFHIGNDGKIYVAETGRYRTSTLDIRDYMSWYDADLAARTVEDREATIREQLGDDWTSLQRESETLRLLEDRDGDGVMDFSSVFAGGFTNVLDGIASGTFTHNDWVYFANIPSLWRMRDNDGDGVADEQEELSHGYGVHFSLTGHDLHGLIRGPDGRIYFSVGDRGAHVRTQEGDLIDLPDEGAVFRMEPDGSNLEVFARGLRNPQELAFNQYGDLFTGDNDCDHGDRERWTHVVDGADYGWRIGYQFSEQNPGGAWMSERIWWTNFPGRVAAYLPPLAHTDNGPSGLAYYPGTGFGDRFNDTFFLCHFKGQDSVSGIKQIRQVMSGAGYAVVDQSELIWNTMPTDVQFGPDGALYFSDWVEGWPKSMKGRIYRLTPEEADTRSAQVKTLLTAGMKERSESELADLLSHVDMRVRLEAQWELAERQALPVLRAVALSSENQLARLHGIWGVGQVFRGLALNDQVSELTALLPLMRDADLEVRGQVMAMLGEAGYSNAFPRMKASLKDVNPRVRRFAALGLSQLLRKKHGKMRFDAEEYLQRTGDDQRGLPIGLTPQEINEFAELAGEDVLLRHRGATLAADMIEFANRFMGEGAGLYYRQWLSAQMRHENPDVRLMFVLALRQIQEPTVANFLGDSDPLVVVEAARAINDAPINSAMPALAAWVDAFAELPPSELSRSMSDQDFADLLLRPVLRRSLNANFRVGDDLSAITLGRFAARGLTVRSGAETAAVVEDAQVEALSMLGQWAAPSNRDRVMGLYRPLESRGTEAAASVLSDQFDLLVENPSTRIQVAAMGAAAALSLTNQIESLMTVLADPEREGVVRAAAVSALGRLETADLEAVLALARNDLDPQVRRAAVRVETMSGSASAAPELERLLKTGSVAEKQFALAELGRISGSIADEIVYGVFRPWIEGQPMDPALELDVLQAARARSDTRFDRFMQMYDESVATGERDAYHWALNGGDAERGRQVFVEHAVAACYRCHAVEGGGGEVGPAMDGIAGRLSPVEILEGIVNPNAKIADGFENQLIEMNNGAFYAGIVRGETDEELVLNSPEDGVVTLPKSEIKSRMRGASGMPEGLPDLLTPGELRDLMAFLKTLE